MKILLENGCYHMQNLGDVAMLQVAINRIEHFLPGTQIIVFTGDSKLLLEAFPKVIPLPASYRRAWIDAKIFPIPYKMIPPKGRAIIQTIEERIRTSHPIIAAKAKYLFSTFSGNSYELKRYFNEMQSSDLLISCGGGLIDDFSKKFVMEFLEDYEIAQRMGKRTAMFGLGMGPITNLKIIKKMGSIFPKLHMLALREGIAGPQILNSLNINPPRIVITGDDAIELALDNCENNLLQNYIGINIRLSERSDLPVEKLKILKEILLEIKEEKNFKLIALPVFLKEPGSDISSLKKLFSDDEICFESAKNIKRPVDLIKEIGKCKLVISGSYHSAVFALAQGIPVLAFVNTLYYRNKFNGLIDQFKIGCKIVDLSSSTIDAEIRSCIEHLLSISEDEKEELKTRAREQVKLSYKAYEEFFTGIN